MADDFFKATVRVDGEHELLQVFDHISDWTRREGKDELTHLARLSETQIRIYAPHGETGELARSVGHTRARFRPGGAGGGGSYEAVAGIPPIVQPRKGVSLYPVDVELGTANNGRLYIYPRLDRQPASVVATKRAREMHGGGALALDIGGERIFRHRVRGQRGQRFVFAAFHTVSIYTRARLLTLGREIVRRRTINP